MLDERCPDLLSYVEFSSHVWFLQRGEFLSRWRLLWHVAYFESSALPFRHILFVWVGEGGNNRLGCGGEALIVRYDIFRGIFVI